MEASMKNIRVLLIIILTIIAMSAIDALTRTRTAASISPVKSAATISVPSQTFIEGTTIGIVEQSPLQGDQVIFLDTETNNARRGLQGNLPLTTTYPMDQWTAVDLSACLPYPTQT